MRSSNYNEDHRDFEPEHGQDDDLNNSLSDPFAEAEREIEEEKLRAKEESKAVSSVPSSDPTDPFLSAIEKASIREVKAWLDDGNNKIDLIHLGKAKEIYDEKKKAGEDVSIDSGIVHIMYELSLAVMGGRVGKDVSEEDKRKMGSYAAAAVARVDGIKKSEREKQSKVKQSNVREVDEVEQAILHQDLEKLRSTLLQNKKLEITPEYIEAVQDKGELRPCMAPIIHILAKEIIEGRHATPRQEIMNKLLYLLAYSHGDDVDSVELRSNLAKQLVGKGATLDAPQIRSWERIYGKSARNKMGDILRESNPEVAYAAHRLVKEKQAQFDDQDFRFKLFKQERRPESPIIALGIVVDAARTEYKEAYKGFGIVGFNMSHYFTKISNKDADDLYEKIAQYITGYHSAWGNFDEAKMEIAERNIIAAIHVHLSRKGGMLAAHLDPLDDKSFDTFLIKKLAESDKMQKYFGWDKEYFKEKHSIWSAVDNFLESKAPEFALVIFRHLIGNYSGKNIAETQLGREWMRSKMIEKLGAEVGQAIPTVRKAA